jgi:hypothetical protein
MVVDVKNLIAAINPDVYCDPAVREEVKKIVKKGGYLKAAETAKLLEISYQDVIHVMATKGAVKREGLKSPIEQHVLVYDAFSQSLEPVYFWILDYVYANFGKADKLVDNFISSAGSGFFAEMQGRATRMQEEAMKMMQTAGVLTKSIIQIIYDLKEFKLRLKQYEDLRSSDEKVRAAAKLSLKQIWIDNVDLRRGNASIAGLSQNFDYVTLRDAFFVADSLEDVKNLDLNDRVKRILEQRISEYLKWVEESERELTKRYEIERSYLRSQVNSLKLYARWAKPYFKAAKQLEQNAGYDANIVNSFNTAVFELVLLAQGKYDPKKDVAMNELPKSVLSEKVRKYSDLILIEFKFRSIPDRTDQKGGYSFRGRVEVTFTGFALNDEELKTLKAEIEKDDFGDVFQMIEGATTESLERLREDIEEFLSDAKEISWSSPSKDEKKSEDVNPFSALFAFEKKEETVDKSPGNIKKDSFWESVLRSQAILSAKFNCRKLYDTYKKAHDMPAFPPTINL